MTDDRDDLLADLRAALDIQPTASFDARVRQRVEREARPRSSASWLSGAAIVGAICVALVLARGHRARPLTDSSESSLAPAAPAIHFEGEAAAQETVPGDTRETRAALPGVERARATASGLAAMRAEIILPPDQEAGVARLVAEIRAGRIAFDEAPPPVASRIALVALRAPARLDVPPLGVEPLSIDDVSEFRR